MDTPDDIRVRAVVAGDPEAWRALSEQLVPQLQAIARSHPSMRSRGLGQLEDDVAEVTTATLERLTRNAFANLARYLEQAEQRHKAGERAQSFDSWIYGAADFEIREHIRKRYGRAPKPDPDADAPQQCRPSRRDLGTNAIPLDDDDGQRLYVQGLSLTSGLSIAAIVAFVMSEFEPDQARAFRMYYQEDRSFAEIAAALGLGEARDADKLVRRLNARLRHRFGAES